MDRRGDDFEDEAQVAVGVGTGRLFGREHELRAALNLLEGSGPRALILSGEPGIGKTAIWRELMHQASGRGFEVLSAMTSGAQVQLTFTALGDLVDALGERSLARLPAPQRHALEVALLRSTGRTVDRRAVSVAFLEMLRARAAERPLVIGIDDLQWLDGPSAGALEFALRRIGDAPVALAATLRTGGHEDEPALDLAAALGPERVQRLEVGPLTLAAIHELLVARLEVELPRPTLIALFEAAGGNPFVAAELGNELVRLGARAEPGVPLPLPPSVRHLIEARIARLAPEVRELLLAAAGLARPTVELLARLRPDAEATLRAAADAGVIEPGFAQGELRFTHPLHARVPYEALEPGERRRLHGRLAGVLDDLEERTRHKALAATRPSAGVAEELDRAAVAAGARGAPSRAAELCTLAARLTPLARDAERGRRLLAAAHWHQRAGEIEQAATLAEGLLNASGVSGDERARAMSVLAAIRADTDGVEAAHTLYDRARREPGTSRTTRCEVHRRIAWLRLGAGEVEAAHRHAHTALALASGRDATAEAGAAAIAALATVVSGDRPPDRLAALAGSPAISGCDESDQWAETSPGVAAAVALLWAGELEQARAPLEAALTRATDNDEPWLAMHALAYLSALATAAGELELGLDRARQYAELAQVTEQRPQRAASLWPLSVALAWRGEEAEARAAAAEGLALARESGHVLYEIGCLSASGLLDLSLERAAEAAEVLARARELADRSGFRALGRMPLLPDSIEALALCGEVDEAAALSTALDRRAAALGSPWAVALAFRGEALVAEARGEHEHAIAALERALAEHARQDRPPERARTELALGRVLRRARRKRDAREALERSAHGFEAIGARLWSQQARRELSRIGGRTVSGGGRLSATEASIAELVRAGQTNQEVAAALHLSPRTVEWNLSKVYRKLGVRSRTQLAAAIAPEIGEPAPDQAMKTGGSPG
jgi:DNA-binding CsgD family transcriptional regulator